MTRTPRLVAIAAVALLVVACQEVPTDPQIGITPNGATMSHYSDHDENLAAFNSGSCSISNTLTGQFQCSWNISDGPSLMNIYPYALVTVYFDCVAKNGTVLSSHNHSYWNYSWQDGTEIEGITTGASTQSNYAVNDPIVIPHYSGKDKKLNICQRSSRPQITSSTLSYWEIYIDNWYSSQANEDYRFHCRASDDRNECET